ncbi:thiamine pyrophosphokinase [Lachnospiraceae bacterium 2_1_46FAA]|nr:thiamine pyrophosphokinase [Lachnospiraceae bacterium 2_1_46FAA]
MNRRAVIVSGGTIQEEFVYAKLKEWEHDVLIGVDKGVEFLYRHQIKPDYIVGDFDSLSEEIVQFYKEKTDVFIREFNPEKDYSDTEIAVYQAMELNCEEIILLGATGSRIDHVLANIQVLAIPHKRGIHAEILDENNRISLIEHEKVLEKEKMYGKYFSVFPLDRCIEKFSIAGAKYPLHNHRLCPYDSLCVSNQAQEEEVKITFSEGIVILIEAKDEN